MISSDSLVAARPALICHAAGRRATWRSRTGQRRGFTLLEVLIATAVTLLMMISLAQIFKIIGDSMQQGRATLELNNRLRTVSYRIRLDLENLTAVPDPPTDPGTGSGYLEYFDGSTTDFTTALAPTTNNISRFGDVDDILMGTVRAGDVWFTGKVPLYVLRGGPSTPPTASDFDLVPIASQHAEVAIFAQPLVSNGKNGIDNPNFDPSYLVADPSFFQDVDGDTFPDAYRLHYRLLLIRPDLNLATGVLPAYLSGTGNPWLIAQQQSGILPNSTPFTLPSPLCDMALAHAQCDLSMRRVFNPADGLAAGQDFVAANDLEDLVDPANRFAHVQVPVAGTASTSMPLMALAQALPIHFTRAAGFSDPMGLDASGNLIVGSGLLHPAYALQSSRTGEDVLASDILAFDVKGYDPAVPLIVTRGQDLAAGVVNVDDDLDGVTDGTGSVVDASEMGWAFSDDLMLSPNDPGYAAALADLANGTAVVGGTGDYVDLGWARKLLAHGGGPPAAANLWSPLSGLSAANALPPGNLPTGFTDSLYKSGRVLRVGNPLAIMQTSYDTWTTAYEGDGNLQAFANNGTVYTGVMRLNGRQVLYGFAGNDNANALPIWRQANIDAATDGIDNPGSLPGIDDVSELETSPPFAVKLRGIMITIRMEDPNTRIVRQMSASQEFVTN